MSLRYPEEVTIESQTKKAQERINRYKLELDVVKKALPIIAKYEGKKITKHIITALLKEFEGARIWLDDQYGMLHINIATNDIKIGDHVHMLVGFHTSQNTINIEYIKQKNQCYLLNEERIPKLKAGIEHIGEIVAIRNEIIEKHNLMTELAEKYEYDYDFDFGK